MKIKLGQTIGIFTAKDNQPILVRIIKPDDLKPMLEYANSLVEEDTFVMLSGTKLTLSQEKKYLSDSIQKVKTGRKIHLVAEVAGQFAGCCEARILDKRKSHVAEVGISLHRKFRNLGIGSILLTALKDLSKPAGLRLLYLHVFENNQQAIHLYRKAGFQTAGTVPGMYFYKNSYVGEITMYLPL